MDFNIFHCLFPIFFFSGKKNTLFSGVIMANSTRKRKTASVKSLTTFMKDGKLYHMLKAVPGHVNRVFVLALLFDQNFLMSSSSGLLFARCYIHLCGGRHVSPTCRGWGTICKDWFSPETSGSQDWTPVSRLSSKCIVPLIHLVKNHSGSRKADEELVRWARSTVRLCRTYVDFHFL